MIATDYITSHAPDCVCEYTCTTPTKWAMRLVGKDEQGRDCILGLDWRGRWHQIAGPVYKHVSHFAAGERAIRDGVVIVRSDNAALLSSPPQFRWHEEATGKRFTLSDRVGDLEVVP